MQAFLDVEHSLTGRRWIGPSVEETRHAERLQQVTGHPEGLCRILAARGVEPDAVEGFLAPSMRELLPDPRALKDMETATARFADAVTQRQQIAIFADYDVDGGASAALLISWLRDLGIPATLYIPDRIDEGYGPNPRAMVTLAKDHDLILCVDCGTLSHDAIAAAKGADVVVLDHHQGGETLPPALAVVNPNRQDETGDLGHLCAAGVVFLMLVEANRRLRDTLPKVPDLMALLDLVALATVADVAPLKGVNRAFVRQGLKVMARRARPGLVALSETARLDTAPTAYHLGFAIGPRVNAGGRIGAPDLGARCLASNTAKEAADLAQKLDTLNTERREIEAEVLTEAMAQVEARGIEAPLTWAAGDGWHPGVVGIVAARLKEATGRPSVVIGYLDGAGKGSGRSINGVDLGAAIHRLSHDGLIEAGGGHPMAAGLSLSRDQLEPAMARLSQLLADQGAADTPPATLRCTGLLTPAAASTELVDLLETAGPFGQAAPAPRFVMPGLRILDAREVGKGHLKFRASDGISKPIEGIAFRAFDGPLGQALANHQERRFHLAGWLETNHWQGRARVQLRLSDAAQLD